MAAAPRRTPLYDRHEAAGARIVDFAGWEMPVQYEGIRQEHEAVRSAVGIFDVSHMGEVEISGPQAEALLQRLLSNDLSSVPVGGAQYSVLCNEEGGVLDDCFAYRLADDRFIVVTNASNHDRDFAWMRDNSEGFDAEVRDVADDWAMIAVQGPAARGMLEPLVEPGLPGRFKVAEARLGDAGLLVLGTGYTGEDGVEILCAPGDAPAVWDALVEAGATPAGLGARDTLRMEVNYHLYGNDLMEERGPIAGGLGWCCKEETGFIGSEAVAAQRAAGPEELLVPFTIDGPGIARQGNPVDGGGEVTSGTLSPTLGVGIGMAYLPASRAVAGEKIEIDVRGKKRPATVAEKPLYRPGDA